MESTIVIRQAGLPDAAAIIELGQKTFVETYGLKNNPQVLRQYIQQKFNHAVIDAELQDPAAIFYLAIDEEKPVGFTKVRDDRKAPGCLEGKRCLELERIYVLKEYQGLRVGKQLMELAKQRAREGAYRCLWLQVWQLNERAVQFYQKSGFVIYDTALFCFGNEKQDDYLMRFDIY